MLNVVINLFAKQTWHSKWHQDFLSSVWMYNGLESEQEVTYSEALRIFSYTGTFFFNVFIMSCANA